MILIRLAILMSFLHILLLRQDSHACMASEVVMVSLYFCLSSPCQCTSPSQCILKGKTLMWQILINTFSITFSSITSSPWHDIGSKSWKYCYVCAGYIRLFCLFQQGQCLDSPIRPNKVRELDADMIEQTQRLGRMHGKCCSTWWSDLCALL